MAWLLFIYMNVERIDDDAFPIPPGHPFVEMAANIKRAEKNQYVSITYKIRALAAYHFRKYKEKPSKLFISVNLGDNLIVEMLTEHPEVAYAASGKANVAFTFEGMKIYRVVEPDCVEVA